MGHNKLAVLRVGITTIQRIDDEIAALKDERKAEFAALKAAGHKAKIVSQMIRELAMDPHERRNYQADLQIYRAALGILDGTPLGDAARRRFEQQNEPSETRVEDDNQEALPDIPDAPKHPAPPTQEEIDAARKEGAEAAKAGKRVTDNPHPADDARRAEWDCGWCSESGGDGMDIPDHLKPKKTTGKSSKTAGRRKNAA